MKGAKGRKQLGTHNNPFFVRGFECCFFYQLILATLLFGYAIVGVLCSNKLAINRVFSAPSDKSLLTALDKREASWKPCNRRLLLNKLG